LWYPTVIGREKYYKKFLLYSCNFMDLIRFFNFFVFLYLLGKLRLDSSYFTTWRSSSKSPVSASKVKTLENCFLKEVEVGEKFLKSHIRLAFGINFIQIWWKCIWITLRFQIFLSINCIIIGYISRTMHKFEFLLAIMTTIHVLPGRSEPCMLPDFQLKGTVSQKSCWDKAMGG